MNLASDANIPNGDGQDVVTIRRQPGMDGTTYVCMTHGDEG